MAKEYRLSLPVASPLKSPMMPRSGVAGLALPVPAHEYGVVIGQTFIQAPGLDAVVDHIIVNAPPMKIADNMGGAPAGLGKDQFPGFLLLWPGLRRRRRGREVRSRQASTASVKEKPWTLMR